MGCERWRGAGHEGESGEGESVTIEAGMGARCVLWRRARVLVLEGWMGMLWKGDVGRERGEGRGETLLPLYRKNSRYGEKH